MEVGNFLLVFWPVLFLEGAGIVMVSFSLQKSFFLEVLICFLGPVSWWGGKEEHWLRIKSTEENFMKCQNYRFVASFVAVHWQLQMLPIACVICITPFLRWPFMEYVQYLMPLLSSVSPKSRDHQWSEQHEQGFVFMPMWPYAILRLGLFGAGNFGWWYWLSLTRLSLQERPFFLSYGFLGLKKRVDVEEPGSASFWGFLFL